MKRQLKKLALRSDTVRGLTTSGLNVVRGGATFDTWTNPVPPTIERRVTCTETVYFTCPP